jgi:hypothetical protein
MDTAIAAQLRDNAAGYPTVLTAGQAGDLLDYTTRGVNHLCRRAAKGLVPIKAWKTDTGNWRIDRDSLLDWFINRPSNKHINKQNFQAKLDQALTDHKTSISPGNTKLGKIPSFNMTPLSSCTGSTKLCRKYCYARQSLSYSLASKLSWHCNHVAAVEYPSEVELYVSQWIESNMDIDGGQPKKPSLFRLHSSGDFISRDYLEMWYRIARDFPEIKFLAFTKNFTLDYSGKPDNMVIMFSVFPDSDIDSIPTDYGYKLSFAVFPDRFPAYQYNDSTRAVIDDQRQTVPCAGDCRICGICWDIDTIDKNVRFAIHGYIRSNH